MITPDWVRMMAAYNAWMNRRLYAQLSELPDEERKAERGAFFGSIHGTLNHLLFGDQAWMARFGVGSPPNGRIGDILYDGFGELCAAREAMDERILAWADGVDSAWLATPLAYRSAVDGQTRRLPVWVLVSHLFNHQTHHRGQLTTLMSQIGLDPGVTDLPWLPGLAEAAGPA